MTGYDIKLRVNDFRPITWRDLIIPSNITFEQLHRIIQTCFGLHGYHLYEFSTMDGYVRISDLNRVTLDDEDILDSNKLKIDDLFDSEKKIRYWYDFGDSWIILIEIKKKVDYDKEYPTIKRYKGEWNLVEDCGGPWAWSETIAKIEEDPDNAVNILVEEYIIHEEEAELPEMTEEYLDGYLDLLKKELKDKDELPKDFSETLKEYSLKFIKEHDLLEDYENAKKEGYNLDTFTAEFVLDEGYDINTLKFDQKDTQYILETILDTDRYY